LIAKNKRVVAGLNVADMELCEWIDPLSFGGAAVFTKAVNRFVELAKSDPAWYGYANKYGLANILAVLCWSVVNVEIPYRYDTDAFKRADFWLLPSETYSTFKAGDCEDVSFLTASALENVLRLTGIRDRERYFCVLGYYYDGNYYWGHAYILWKNPYLARRLKPAEDHSTKYYVFETTWDTEVSPFVWYNWHYERYIPAVIFNRSYCSTLLSPEAQMTLGVSPSYVERHREAIQNMIDYVTTGVKLKESWRHKTQERMVPRVEGVKVKPEKPSRISKALGRRKVNKLLKKVREGAKGG